MITREFVLQKISEFASLCTDIPTFSEALDIIPTGEGAEVDFNLKANETVTLIKPDHHATSQLFAKLGIPPVFFGRCRRTIQDQIIDQFNRDKNFLLRCLKEGEVPTYCRAVVSQGFTVDYDNVKVFPVLLSALPDETYQLAKFTTEAQITRLQIEFPDTKITYDGQEIISGISVINSETGFSSLWIEPIAIINNKYILANRANAEGALKLIHKGSGLDIEEIKNAYLNCKDVAQAGCLKYLELKKQPVDTDDAQVFLKSMPILSKRLCMAVAASWENTQELTKFRLVRDILDAAKDLPLVARIMVEQNCGRYLGLFRNHRETLNRYARTVSEEPSQQEE